MHHNGLMPGSHILFFRIESVQMGSNYHNFCFIIEKLYTIQSPSKNSNIIFIQMYYNYLKITVIMYYYMIIKYHSYLVVRGRSHNTSRDFSRFLSPSPPPSSRTFAIPNTRVVTLLLTPPPPSLRDVLCERSLFLQPRILLAIGC